MGIVERVEKGSVLVIELDGALVMGRESKRLEWIISERVKEGRRKVVIDLGKAPYIDSAGIGVVVASLSNVTRAGGQMRVAGANSFVQGILEKTGVDGILALDATVADSLSVLAAASEEAG
jgi:anti-anti-sigma factor